MIKFPSIESFRHVNTSMKRMANFHGTPLPTIQYEGRVKLHGTNAGIHYVPAQKPVPRPETWWSKLFGIERQPWFEAVPAQLIPQSRERILGLGKEDNAGFAAWVEANRKELIDLFDMTFEGQEVTVYGEWCGGNIQKNVALNQLPKMLVVFGYIDHTDFEIMDDGVKHYMLRPYPYFVAKQPPSMMGIEGVIDDVEREYNDSLMDFYHIDLVKPKIVVVDFNTPNISADVFDALTAEYEAECPWAKMWGVSGVGEGLVWQPSSIYEVNAQTNRARFKTKGEKHGNPATKNKVKVAIDAEKIGAFNEFIEMILPETRLHQGLDVLQQRQLELTKKNTGEYLKWVANDVLKEESDRIYANEFPLPVVMAEVSKLARQFYFKNTDD